MVHITLGKWIRMRKDHPETRHSMQTGWRLRSIPWIYIWDHLQKCLFLLMAWVSRFRLGCCDAVSVTRILVGFVLNKRFIGCVGLFVFVCVFFYVENRPNAFGRFLGTQLGTEMKTFPSSQKSGLGRWPLHLDDFFCPKFGSIMYLNKTDLPSLQLTVCTWKFVIPVSFWESLFQGGYSLSLG